MRTIFLIILISSDLAFAVKKIPAKKTVVENAAKTDSTQGITLNESLKKGLEYSPELKKASASVEESEATLSKERALLFPTINATASASTKVNSINASGSSAASSATAGTATGPSGDNYAAALTLSQPLYVGGAVTSGLSLYKAKAESARQSYFSTKQDTALNIINAFYGLSKSQQLLDTGNQNREILKSYVDITSYYERIGRSRKMDKLQATVNYSLSLADVESTSNDLKKSQASLKKLLGVEDSSPLNANHTVVITPIEKISLEQALKAAKDNNPEIKIKQIALEQVDYNRDVDLATDFPNLYLTGSYGYQSPDKSSLFTTNSQTYNIGLNLTVPLFSGLSSISKRNIYTQQSYEAQHDLRSTEDGIREQIEEALSTLQSTTVQLELAQSSVKEARSALEMANKGYQHGIASSNDVINLQQTRYNAEKLWVNTQFGYLQTLATLRKLMGIDLEKAYEK